MRVYEFANFRLNSQERVLYRDGQPVQLAPKVLDTLLVLVARHGQLVSKETLMGEIWDDCFVEENNLTQYIFTLRRLLGENKEGAKFIETAPRRGYRFTAEVRISELSGFESETSADKEIHVSAQTFGAPAGQAFPEKYRAEKPRSTIHRVERLFAFGFVVLLLAASLGFAFRYDWQKNSLASNSREVRFKRLTENGNLFGVAISPDGNLLAYVAIDGKNSSIRLRNILTESEVVVVAPIEAILGAPRFSPDGNFIYYSQAIKGTNGVIYQIPVLGGQPRQIASNNWSGFSVSPDGREIAFPRGESGLSPKHFIIVAQTDGSGERVVATRNAPDYYALWGPAPAWSPHGKHLTVVTGKFGESGHRLVEVSLPDGRETEIKTQSDWKYIDAVEWANKNELIIAGPEKDEEKPQLWRVTFPGGAVERLTNDFNSYVALDLTKDASRLVALKVTENLHLWLFDKETNAVRQLTTGENRADGRSGLAFAPDGRIVFTARNKNEYDIFSLDPGGGGGGQMVQLTKNAGRVNSEPSVSPDNRFIAFISDRTGLPRLWIMKRDGSEARQLTAPSDDRLIEERTPFFSSDGLWVYYTLMRNGHQSIYKISATGEGEPVEMSNPGKEAFEAAVSPDRKYLAFGSHDNKAKKPWYVGIRSLADGREKNFDFSAFRFQSRWTPDSQSLVSIEQSFHGANLWQTNIETNQRKQITNFNAERIYRFDVSRDGRFFVVSRGNGFYDAVLIER